MLTKCELGIAKLGLTLIKINRHGSICVSWYMCIMCAYVLYCKVSRHHIHMCVHGTCAMYT